MKYVLRMFVLSGLAVLVFAGWSCRQAPGAEPSSDQPEAAVSDKDLYVTNIQYKLIDLKAHIGKIEEKRASLSANSLEIFDQQVSALKQNLAEFESAFQRLRDSAAADFMTERGMVNEQLQKTEELYLKIITDYKIELPVDVGT